MTKAEAAAIFGGKYTNLASALAMTRAGISQWPDELTEAQTDRVLGAALRLKMPIPSRYRPRRARRATELEADRGEILRLASQEG